MIAMDPRFFSTGYIPHLESMLAALTADNAVRVPGQRRGELRAKHAQFGVEVPQSLLESIAALSS